MPRYALRIEYDGTAFSGWQVQTGQPTVQGALEAALGRIDAGFAGHSGGQGVLGRVAAAGRTDAGVHATGQVAHADLARDWAPQRLRAAINHHLRPAPAAVLEVAEVAPDWHARFSAIERRYLFRILMRPAPSVLAAGRVWQRERPLDVAAMRAGAAHLIGRHDFTTFRATHCQAESPLRTLDEITIAEADAGFGPELHLRFRARSFLHHQVRSITGSLERVGAGAWPPGRIAEALAARDRTACGPIAPPQGLYLTGVGYPCDPFAAS
jgi:tRNA pseudouridine38-40 synthase